MKVRIIALAMLALLFGVNVGAQSNKPVVIASHSILADVARNVAGDLIEVRTLIPWGSDPHHFIPTPSDMTAVADADLVLINGIGYEETLLEAIENAGADVNIVVASSCIDIRPAGAYDYHDDHGHDDHDDHAHEDDHDDHAHEDDHDDHAHEDDHDDHAHGDMESHCDEHDAEFASLFAAHHDMDEEDDHEHGEDGHGHEEDTDLSLFSGEWLSVWAFPESDIQPAHEAILAATPELTQDLLSQYLEAANYTPFSELTFSEDSVAFDGVACDYAFSEQPVPSSLGEVSLFETADEACADMRFLLLGAIHGTVEDGTYHFHLRIAPSYGEVVDEQSLSFPSAWPSSTTAADINALFSGFARPIGMRVAATYGVEIAMSEEEMAAMSAEEDDHAHEEDEHGHDEHGHDDSATLGRLEDIECAGHDHGADGHEHAHEEGSCDPHVWLDPHNVVYWVMTIRDSFSEIDPDNASEYHELALAYAMELDSLESDFIWPTLENLPEEKRLLVTAHDALGYLAGTFGFEIVSTVIPGVSTVVEPSASDVAAVIDVIRERELTAIFGESTTSDRILQVIAAETGVEIAPLYTDSLGDVDGPAGAYLDYMRYNFTTIVEALSG
ncbi:MAG: zinc ABC transporter substrate-binding protein [Chloroflexi bacterium]|nr:zinc ABC transporter substrate-binding protein [Chloroflexota bacterium]